MKRLLPILALIPSMAAGQGHDRELIGIGGAIGSAERAMSARAIEVGLESRGDRPVYEIDLVRGTTIHRVLVDAHSGRLLSIVTPRIENLVRGWFDADRLRVGGRARSVVEQLRALEQRTGGEARSLLFRLRDGRGVYEIELATAAGVGKVHIDAATGQRLAMALED